jgi:prophage antirepressor-like protein
MSALVPFTFEGAALRVIDRAGEPWFVLADVCRVLDIGNPAQAATRLDDDEKGITTNDTLGGAQEMTIINESGLYSLILTSRKEAAKRFKKWVTSEVLPSIRKTGSYAAPGSAPARDPMDVLRDPVAMRGLLLTYSEKVLTLESTIATQAPKVAALDRIASAEGSTCITDAAKTLQIRPKELFRWLSANGWIYRRVGGSGWIAYQNRLQQGFLEHKVATFELPSGEKRMTEHVLVTPKGLAKLAEVHAAPAVAA